MKFEKIQISRTRNISAEPLGISHLKFSSVIRTLLHVLKILIVFSFIHKMYLEIVSKKFQVGRN